MTQPVCGVAQRVNREAEPNHNAMIDRLNRFAISVTVQNMKRPANLSKARIATMLEAFDRRVHGGGESSQGTSGQKSSWLGRMLRF